MAAVMLGLLVTGAPAAEVVPYHRWRATRRPVSSVPVHGGGRDPLVALLRGPRAGEYRHGVWGVLLGSCNVLAELALLAAGSAAGCVCSR